MWFLSSASGAPLSATEHCHALDREATARGRAVGRSAPGPGDWLVALLALAPTCIAGLLLVRLGCDLEALTAEAERRWAAGELGRGADAEAFRRLVGTGVERLDHGYIGTEHVLFALLRPESGGSAACLMQAGASHEGAVREFNALGWRPPDVDQRQSGAPAV